VLSQTVQPLIYTFFPFKKKINLQTKK